MSDLEEITLSLKWPSRYLDCSVIGSDGSTVEDHNSENTLAREKHVTECPLGLGSKNESCIKKHFR